MSNNAYGNLGNEMRTMKRQRETVAAATKRDRSRIRTETARLLSDAEKFMAETSKSNVDLKARTRRALSDAQADLKAQSRQMAREADKLAAAIGKSVSALKAEARQVLADADRFMVDTNTANTRLKGQTRRALSQAQADLKAQSRQMATGIRKDVAALRAETGRIVAEAAAMVASFSNASRQRAGEWRDIVVSLRGNGRAEPSRPEPAASPRRPRATAKARKPRAKSRAKARGTATKKR